MSTIVPVYYQIKQALRKKIMTRQFEPGEKIPSENELTVEFGVNRLTVRHAISQLVQEGFLHSKRGMGTFITTDEKLINSLDMEFSGLMDDLYYHVRKFKTMSVEIDRITLPKWASTKLRLPVKRQQGVRIRRVRFKRQKSFAYTINYLPLDLGNKITEKDLYEKPLLWIIEQDLGIPLTEAFQTIEATLADQVVAEKLEVPIGSPILFIERIMYTKGKKPIELVQSFNRGDAYRYAATLKTMKSKRGNVWIHQK